MTITTIVNLSLSQHYGTSHGNIGSKTHSYHEHTISNGLVEHFYCQLKTTLKCQPIHTKWVSAFPLALLGIHTALKLDLHCSVAELEYTEPLSIHQESSLCPIKVQAQLILPVVMLPNLGTLCSSSKPRQLVNQNSSIHTSTSFWHLPYVFMWH